jgi:Ser-tRNA(Ala) deacylase AlaX
MGPEKNTTLLYLEDIVSLSGVARVNNIFSEDGRVVIILDQTLFYPQGGGQPCDQGVIESSAGKFLVDEVRFVDGMARHVGTFIDGNFTVGSIVEYHIDTKRRILHQRLHSAGHIIDKAILELGLPWKPGKGYHFPQGPYVEYAGSLDGLDKEKIKSDIESRCNAYINSGSETAIKFMSREEMLRVCHYTPDFPVEKGERARIVFHDGYAMPCGGTPVVNLRDIGKFTVRKIKQEGMNIRVGYDVERT